MNGDQMTPAGENAFREWEEGALNATNPTPTLKHSAKGNCRVCAVYDYLVRDELSVDPDICPACRAGESEDDRVG